MNPIFVLVLVTLTSSTVGELKVLSTENGEMGPPPCALTCTGVTSYSGWIDGNDEAWKNIDTTGCGFVGTPTISSAILKGNRCPSVYIHAPSPSGARVYTVEDIAADTLYRYKCRIHWTATGYNCN
jgi:hypothetical protein